MEGSGAYEHATDGLRLEQLGLTTDELQLTAQGQVAQLTGDRLADIKGEIEYDLQQVTAKMQPVVGSDVRFNGRQKRSFFVRGPLVFYAPAARTGEARSIPASYAGGASRVTEPQVSTVFQWPQALTAQAGFGWSAADVYGLQAGEGNVEARLANEVLAVTPLDLTINGGRVTAAPRIKLGKTPLTLLLRRGRADVGQPVPVEPDATKIPPPKPPVPPPVVPVPPLPEKLLCTVRWSSAMEEEPSIVMPPPLPPSPPPAPTLCA